MYQSSSQHQHKDSQMSEKEKFERQIYLPLKNDHNKGRGGKSTSILFVGWHHI